MHQAQGLYSKTARMVVWYVQFEYQGKPTILCTNSSDVLHFLLASAQWGDHCRKRGVKARARSAAVRGTRSRESRSDDGSLLDFYSDCLHELQTPPSGPHESQQHGPARAPLPRCQGRRNARIVSLQVDDGQDHHGQGKMHRSQRRCFQTLFGAPLIGGTARPPQAHLLDVVAEATVTDYKGWLRTTGERFKTQKLSP